MRESGKKRAFWAKFGLGGLGISLGIGVIAVSSHSTVTASSWVRSASDWVIAPAHAERANRRNRNRGSGDNQQAETALKRAQQDIQQAEAAKKRLQDADVAQKRMQQMQETAAAHKRLLQTQEAAAAQKRIQQAQEMAAAQKRAQDLQRLEASQKQLQQVQNQRPDLSQRRPQHLEASRQQHRYQPAASQPSPNVQAATRNLNAADRHRVALEETMAKLRVRNNAPRQETFKQETPRQTAGSRHQAMLEQVTAKLRGRQQAPPHHAGADRPSAGNRHQAALAQVMSKLRGHGQVSRDAPRYNDRSSRDGFGGHGRQPALQSAIDRLRGRHLADRNNDRFDRGRSGQGNHESRQHAIYSHILTKFSRHGRRSREEPKETASAPPPVTPTVTTPAPVATPPPETKPAPVATPPPTVTPPPVVVATTKKNPKRPGAELLPGTQDVGREVTTAGSKLPEVVSSLNSRGSTESDRTSDRTMSRLGGPEQPSSDERNSRDDRSSGDERGVGRPRVQKKDDDSDNDGSASAKPTVRNLGRRVAGSLLPQPGSFRPNEVLAVNMDAAKLARALQRNFKVLEKIEYPALGFNLTRLATPDTQNAIIGRTTLHEELPSDGFGLNHIYTSPRPSGAEAGGDIKAPPAPSTPPSPGFNGDRRAGGACASDRCFGISVINWRPQLAACARGIKIGIIDTGVDEKHPAFAGVHFKHEDFTPRNAKKPPNHHGTGIFSLLAGSPRSSTPGLVPDATFLFGDAFFTDRNGNAMSDTVTMLKALNWLKGAGVDIANLSFAGPPDELVHDAIRELAKTGTVILAAAGNEGQDAPPSYPAAYKEVIAVTAVDRNLAPYAYANRGSHIDIAAPGVDVWTALPNRREGLQTGTSFAVPFVTSVVALSYRPEERTAHADPLVPKRQALAQLQKNIKAIGGRGQSSIFGAGIVQAPSHCDPRGPAIVAKMDGWNGIVQAAPSANPPTHLQAGSWTSTILPVASRK